MNHIDHRRVESELSDSVTKGLGVGHGIDMQVRSRGVVGTIPTAHVLKTSYIQTGTGDEPATLGPRRTGKEALGKLGNHGQLDTMSIRR
jgi:hypothetical protein